MAKSCSHCDGVDTMEMVQCDNCNEWYHFKCVGVTQEIEQHAWICSKCEDVSKPKNGEIEKPIDIDTQKSMKSVASCKSSVDLQLMKLEEQKALEEKFLNKKYEILAKSSGGSHSSVLSLATSSRHRTQDWVYSHPHHMKHPTEHHDDMPMESKLVARQALSKDLPIFSGKPEDWPVFISSYEESTKLCGYSYAENLLRLQKALKGKAYDLVVSQLLLPKNVPEILKTLKMMFGRPEIIINSLICKIRNEASPRADKLESLISYAIAVKNLSATMEASGMNNHLTNPILMQELVSKLPAQIKLNWALHIGEEVSDIAIFSKWLFNLAEAATRVTEAPISSKISANLHAHDTDKPAYKGKDQTVEKSKCGLCNRFHTLAECDKFATLKLFERWNFVKANKLCRSCLKKHGQFQCSFPKCPVDDCEAKHHKLLHKFAVPNYSQDVQRNQTKVLPGATVSTHYENGKTLFKILPVTLYNNGRSIEVFAMLDDGSNVTLVDEDVCQTLGLKGEQNTLCLRWTSDMTRQEDSSMCVNMLISGSYPNAKRYELNNVQTVKQLSLPEQSLKEKQVMYYGHLKNLNINTYQSVTPKLLIGLNNGFLINTMKMAEGCFNEPCGSKTRLGWVVHGGGDVVNKGQNIFHINCCECAIDLENIKNQMSAYFSLESQGKPYQLQSADNERASALLQETTKRVGERFETGLLWKSDMGDIPDSCSMATKRLQCLERKLDPESIANVTQQIDNLVSKGYARKLSPEEANTNGNEWYLPIFTVKNPNKPNKIRLVWDAAAKVNGTSLNSMLLKGPDLNCSLLSVLFGFRMHKIAISAYIKEMFHQVRIRKEDQNFQRFLWRNGDLTRDPDTYVMEVLTFGAACSPCSAQFVKNKNALEFENQYPRAVKSILNHHYVDDLLDSTDSVKDAIRLAKDVANVHKKGGFLIRNFRSNSSEVLLNIQDLEESVPAESQRIQSLTEKVLGMWWVTETDEFTYSFKFNRLNKDILSGETRPTKLDVLRTLMSIFDPLGFLSPYVIHLKMLLQNIWKATEGWNTLVNDVHFEKWLFWLKLLPGIEQVKIPRWYIMQKGCSVQLHIFVDASEYAYAAVGYFRISCNGDVKCSLIMSKAKVAPKQPLSIPRMELMAAVLGTRLAKIICDHHEIIFQKRFFWSDSNTVLSWISSDARNYKQFVMFRIGEILEASSPFEWRYVPTKINVADDATKWKSTNVFDPENRWYKGPSFLFQDKDRWPQKKQVLQSQEEIRPNTLMLHDGKPLPIEESCVNIKRFSTWRKLLNTVCYVYKVVCKLKRKDDSWPILQKRAENYIFRKIQLDGFKDEISSLLNEKNICKASSLYTCSPYLDSDGILRIRGRIDLADVKESIKRPILLPRNHHGTYLILQHYHELFHHLNHDTCLNEIRQKFYIPRLRCEVKKIRTRCQHCKNFNAKPVAPEMSMLPSARLAAYTRPFSYVGIDYFGPILVTVARHKEKRWGVIFTCLTIRAVHLEVSRDLSTDSFILQLQNFIARRGNPISIHCDNGTNFRGAEIELRKAVQEIDFKKLEQKFSSASTSWHFNPPAAPHMGGSWERLIRSIKNILYKISPNYSFRDDTLQSALIECERIINSRPLTYVELESSEEALTPNHFLLGSSNGHKPLGSFENDCDHRRHWRRIQHFADLFWKRWVNEYLPTLTKRTRWFTKERDLVVDDIVIIVDPTMARNSWPQGRIISVNRGKDNVVRSATVKTQDGIFIRPATKLARLDVRN